jgi:hypothetical protein
MVAQVFQYKNLPQNFKSVLNAQFEDEQFVYVIKDVEGNPKSITTSIIQAITKVQAGHKK